MIKDNFSRRLSSIRNAIQIKSSGVEIPETRLTKALSHILLQEGLIEEILEIPFSPEVKSSISTLFLRLKYLGAQRNPVIKNMQRVSRPSLRVYAKCKEIPKIFGGSGLVILSTSQGVMTDRIAKRHKLGDRKSVV